MSEAKEKIIPKDVELYKGSPGSTAPEGHTFNTEDKAEKEPVATSDKLIDKSTSNSPLTLLGNPENTVSPQPVPAPIQEPPPPPPAPAASLPPLPPSPPSSIYKQGTALSPEITPQHDVINIATIQPPLPAVDVPYSNDKEELLNTSTSQVSAY